MALVVHNLHNRKNLQKQISFICAKVPRNEPVTQNSKKKPLSQNPNMILFILCHLAVEELPVPGVHDLAGGALLDGREGGGGGVGGRGEGLLHPHLGELDQHREQEHHGQRHVCLQVLTQLRRHGAGEVLGTGLNSGLLVKCRYFGWSNLYICVVLNHRHQWRGNP